MSTATPLNHRSHRLFVPRAGRGKYGLQKTPPEIFLPFARCNKVIGLTEAQRKTEYDRAAVVKLLVETGQQKQVQATCEGSIFRPVELLAMVQKFPRLLDWRKRDLWMMLQTSVNEKS
jgi:hypothetical protein